jgi:hypothetical protein
MFTLTIETDNDAFGQTPDFKVAQLRRSLQRISERLFMGDTEGKVLDTNGNTVGRWELTA